MDSFERKILCTIETHALLKRGEKVVVSISGGPDSVALLTALNEISRTFDLTVLAAHANHQLRGAESDEDQTFVAELCDRLEIPLASGKIRVFTLHSSGNLENAARQQRYDFLANVANREAAVLATGHNRDDQAETFLMKLLRGAGPSGLAGIFIKRQHHLGSTSVPVSVRVVRPLLEVTRTEILTYLNGKGQSFREDSSNSQLHYDRNWIRHQLLPLLRDRFNARITATLARNATLFGEIEEYLEQEAENLLDTIGTESVEDFAIDIENLFAAPITLRKQVAKQVIRRVKGDLLNISQGHIQALLDLGVGNSGRQVHLPGNLRAIREFDSLRINRNRGEVDSFRYHFQLPGQLGLPEVQKRIEARKVPVEAGRTSALLSSRFDRVIVRNRRPGDRYLISAKSQGKSLKKLFLEKRIPISDRDRIVMLESENRILWIEGFPINPTAMVSKSDSEGFEVEVVSETFGPPIPSK